MPMNTQTWSVARREDAELRLDRALVKQLRPGRRDRRYFTAFESDCVDIQ
jgi:hypothetical protein